MVYSINSINGKLEPDFQEKAEYFDILFCFQMHATQKAILTYKKLIQVSSNISIFFILLSVMMAATRFLRNSIY